MKIGGTTKTPSTAFATTTVLLSGWRLISSSTAGLPLAVTTVYTGITDGLTECSNSAIDLAQPLRLLARLYPHEARYQATDGG